MYILTDKNTGGVYAVFNKDRIKTVQVFESEEDAVRYNDLLMADGYEEELEILEVDANIVAANCGRYDYYYTIISKDEFVIPPT